MRPIYSDILRTASGARGRSQKRSATGRRLRIRWWVSNESVPPELTTTQQINCLHEIFFDAALEEADRLDAYLDQHRKPIGPLHGLPISLKDMLHVKGLDTSMGYVGWLGNFEGKTSTGKEKVFESEIVKELRALGAVLYVKTSVPQSLMVHEGTNNLIGYTENPKNRLLSVGGSSGGEGGLLALKGSALGVGTDIGGSIRVPAAWNGTYGLKPSTGRLPFEGVAVSMDGQISAPTALGPMATSPEALTLLTKAVLSREPWHHDSTVVPMPWNDEAYQAILEQAKNADKPLCFAILRSDGIVNPHPPITRAINQTVSAIESLGHKVIDWNPPSHSTAISLRLKTWIWDGGHDIHAQLALSGEPPLPHVVASYGKEPSSQLNVCEVNATNIAIREYRKEYMEYWNSTASLTGTGRPVDAVIMPVAPYAAAPRGKNEYPGYSIFVNLLDYTVAAFPVTEVDEKVDAKYGVEGYAKLNDADGRVHDMCK